MMMATVVSIAGAGGTGRAKVMFLFHLSGRIYLVLHVSMTLLDASFGVYVSTRRMDGPYHVLFVCSK